jgi:hypothetical protein
MTKSESMKPQNEPLPQGDNADTTPEADALHGEKAREEQYAQPEAVAIDGDTLIAAPETGDTNRR